MDLPVGVANSHSVEGKDFEQVVFAVLLGEEKPRPLCLEGLRSDQSVNRAVSFRHVQPGRFVVFIDRHPIQAERYESVQPLLLAVHDPWRSWVSACEISWRQ